MNCCWEGENRGEGGARGGDVGGMPPPASAHSSVRQEASWGHFAGPVLFFSVCVNCCCRVKTGGAEMWGGSHRLLLRIHPSGRRPAATATHLRPPRHPRHEEVLCVGTAGG